MRGFYILAMISILLAVAWAGPQQSTTSAPALPNTLATARSVYVTTWEGDQFKPDLLQSDQRAAGAVQDALRQWGKLGIVARASDADIVLVVMSRPTEDVLEVYDAHYWPSHNYLWRTMGRGGLQSGETPLLTQFKNAFDNLQKQK